MSSKVNWLVEFPQFSLGCSLCMNSTIGTHIKLLHCTSVVLLFLANLSLSLLNGHFLLLYNFTRWLLLALIKDPQDAAHWCSSSLYVKAGSSSLCFKMVYLTSGSYTVDVVHASTEKAAVSRQNIWQSKPLWPVILVGLTSEIQFVLKWAENLTQPGCFGLL